MTDSLPARYGYLGPEGTFTEAALINWLDGSPAQTVSCTSVIGALDAVRQNLVVAAMVPLENSVEGSVSTTLDSLATGVPLVILAEAQTVVSFSLLARPGVKLADVRRVTTHPHAQAQCRGWLDQHLPHAEYSAAASTAAAAAMVVDPASGFDAAIAAPLAAEVYRLDVVADNIGDHAAETRFVLVGRPTPPPPASGHDRTSLVLFIDDDHPGALLEILTEFAVRGVNLTRIESRPTGSGIGAYFFSIDVEGHVDEARVGEALMGLRRVCAEIRYLGSYPRLDRVSPVLRKGVHDAEFRQAQAWLSRIREGRA